MIKSEYHKKLFSNSTCFTFLIDIIRKIVLPPNNCNSSCLVTLVFGWIVIPRLLFQLAQYLWNKLNACRYICVFVIHVCGCIEALVHCHDRNHAVTFWMKNKVTAGLSACPQPWIQFKNHHCLPLAAYGASSNSQFKVSSQETCISELYELIIPLWSIGSS